MIEQLVARGAADLKAKLEAVLVRLRERPAIVNVTNPLTGAAAAVVVGAFDVSSEWWLRRSEIPDSCRARHRTRPHTHWPSVTILPRYSYMLIVPERPRTSPHTRRGGPST